MRWKWARRGAASVEVAVRPADERGGRVQRADEQAGGWMLLVVCGVGHRECGQGEGREGVDGSRSADAVYAEDGAEPAERRAAR